MPVPTFHDGFFFQVPTGFRIMIHILGKQMWSTPLAGHKENLSDSMSQQLAPQPPFDFTQPRCIPFSVSFGENGGQRYVEASLFPRWCPTWNEWAQFIFQKRYKPSTIRSRNLRQPVSLSLPRRARLSRVINNISTSHLGEEWKQTEHEVSPSYISL